MATPTPLGGVGPAGSKIAPKNRQEADGASAPPSPLGGVNPQPRPPTPKESARVSTGGLPLGGVGGPGSRLAGGPGLGVVVHESPQMRAVREAQERQAAKEAQAVPESPSEASDAVATPDVDSEPSEGTETVGERPEGLNAKQAEAWEMFQAGKSVAEVATALDRTLRWATGLHDDWFPEN